MKQTKHNPAYKLVQATKPTNKGYIELVYGETNEGENKGLEIYFYMPNELQHYRSVRYLQIDVPSKYRTDYVNLRQYVRDNKVKPGHKLDIGLTLLTK